MLKRFWLFCGDAYENGGGLKDFNGAFETRDEAIEAARGDWAHVLDAHNEEVVAWREHNEGWQFQAEDLSAFARRIV